MKVSVEGVLLDYGMVLSGPPDAGAWARMGEIAALDEVRFRAAYWAFRDQYDRGMKGADYWRAVGLHAGVELTAGQVAELIEADTLLWTQSNEPMIAWARRLHSAGMRTGVLSNLGDAMTQGVMARMPWLARFDVLVWSYALGMAKPDEGIYRAAVEAMGVEAERILFIDDREENVAGGVAAGMQGVLYTTQREFVAEMERRGLGWLWVCGEGEEVGQKQIPPG